MLKDIKLENLELNLSGGNNSIDVPKTEEYLRQLADYVEHLKEKYETKYVVVEKFDMDSYDDIFYATIKIIKDYSCKEDCCSCTNKNCESKYKEN